MSGLQADLKKAHARKKAHGVRFYMLVSVLPILLLFIAACLYLHYDLRRVSANADLIVGQAIPSMEHTQNTLSFFSELGYLVGDVVSNYDVTMSRRSYLRAKNLLSEHYHLLSVQGDLERIENNLDWLMIMRNNFGVTRTKMFAHWQAVYLLMVDLHYRHGIELDHSKLSFFNYGILSTLRERDQKLYKQIRANLDPFRKFCSDGAAELQSAEDVRQCREFSVMSGELLENYSRLGRIYRDMNSLRSNTYELIRGAAALFATSEYDILGGNLKDLQNTAHLYQFIITIFMVLAIGLLLMQNAVIHYCIVKPLTYITGVVHAFAVHRIVPERFFSSGVREIREIEALLPSVFTEVKKANELNVELLKTNQNLKDMSLIDDLTHIRNRRALNEFVAENSRTRASFAVLMIDIDHFKALNDTQGHLKGDEVLELVANTLIQNTSRSDHVFRYGGEEFCVILGSVSQRQARKVGDRLRTAVEALQIPNIVDGRSCFITISVGVSTAKAAGDREERSMTAFIAEADIALYRAKNSGRNCTCQYEKSELKGGMGRDEVLLDEESEGA